MAVMNNLPFFIIFLPLAFTTLHYGSCPHLEVPEYPDEILQRFEGDLARVIYFSNVRFERLFERPPVRERYMSSYMIQLKQSAKPDEECFFPFRLFRRPVVEVQNKDGHLFAFSCAEDGNRKLEYVWIIRREQAAGMSLSDVQKSFGRWFNNTTTKVSDLVDSHHQIPMCGEGVLLTAVYCVVGVIIGILVIIVAVICWRKLCRPAMIKNDSDVAERNDQEHNLTVDSASVVDA